MNNYPANFENDALLLDYERMIAHLEESDCLLEQLTYTSAQLRSIACNVATSSNSGSDEQIALYLKKIDSNIHAAWDGVRKLNSIAQAQSEAEQRRASTAAVYGLPPNTSSYNRY